MHYIHVPNFPYTCADNGMAHLVTFIYSCAIPAGSRRMSHQLAYLLH
jgi:hypothetical protein